MNDWQHCRSCDVFRPIEQAFPNGACPDCGDKLVVSTEARWDLVRGEFVIRADGSVKPWRRPEP